MVPRTGLEPVCVQLRYNAPLRRRIRYRGFWKWRLVNFTPTLEDRVSRINQRRASRWIRVLEFGGHCENRTHLKSFADSCPRQLTQWPFKDLRLHLHSGLPQPKQSLFLSLNQSFSTAYVCVIIWGISRSYWCAPSKFKSLLFVLCFLFVRFIWKLLAPYWVANSVSASDTIQWDCASALIPEPLGHMACKSGL